LLGLLEGRQPVLLEGRAQVLREELVQELVQVQVGVRVEAGLEGLGLDWDL
jgi:hypothetical protein